MTQQESRKRDENDLTTILWLLVVATAIGVFGGLSYTIGGEIERWA